MRVWLKISIVLCAAAFAASCAPEGTPDLRIVVTQQSGAEIAVSYEWRRPQKLADFYSIAGGYRSDGWTLPDGFELTTNNTFDRVARRDGKRFRNLTVVVAPAYGRLEKEYQPLAPYGAGGVLVYTGHIWPVNGADERVDAAFDFKPLAGAWAVAFGDRAEAIHNWRSPENHPSFVYFGPIEPVETDNVMAIVDPAAPKWIVRLFNRIVPESFAALSEMFDFEPETKPNLFLTAETDGDDGRLSYGGDALPGQFQITLEGGAWREPSDRAREIFTFSTIHEAVHLWQAAARPGADEPPEWIHEGAADAIAAETMVDLGLWDSAEMSQRIRDVKAECAASLENGSLNSAKERGAYRALYACGQVIAFATARAEGAGAAAFWRDFIMRARKAGGYTEEMFYEVAANRTGSQEFADALKDFARTPLADPARDIDALFDRAGALAREAGR